MKKSYYQTLITFVTFSVCIISCTDTEESIIDLGKDNPEKTLEARALVSDTLIAELPTPLEETADMLALKERYTEMQRSNISTLSTYSYPDVDENFSSNIYAIRELPITIKARSIANGSTSGYNYFTCRNAGEEVVLATTTRGISINNRFYLKILPSTAGIPYLIYSMASNTPLSVGYYNSNPDEKIIMTCKEEPSSYYSCSWDLLPSPSYSGYFTIQSNSYLGQHDPNDMWSVFYYVLEASANNKLRYNQYVANKAEQEFLITPIPEFELQSIEYDLNSASISTGGYDVQTLTGTNSYSESKALNFNFSLSALETSYFLQDKSYLTVNLSNEDLLLPRPHVESNTAVLPNTETPKDANYKSTSTQNISRTLAYTYPITAEPRSIYTATAKFKYYYLSMDYVIKARYTTNGDTREVKFTGRWSGKVYEDPTIKAPECSYTRTDLDEDGDIILKDPILPPLPIDTFKVVTP